MVNFNPGPAPVVGQSRTIHPPDGSHCLYELGVVKQVIAKSSAIVYGTNSCVDLLDRFGWTEVDVKQVFASAKSGKKRSGGHHSKCEWCETNRGAAQGFIPCDVYIVPIKEDGVRKNVYLKFGVCPSTNTVVTVVQCHPER